MIELGCVAFSSRGEDQIDWVDRYGWFSVGQTIRYALAGNPVVKENARSGRPITLTAELPWSWLTASTMQALYDLANTSQTMAFTFDSFSANVRFRRDQGAVVLTPIDQQKLYYTGSIYLIEV